MRGTETGAGIASSRVDVADVPGKRGRKAHPPNPDDGPLSAFAHQLWLLKRRAGDPSYATMCTDLGAAASRSSLAAATRGTTLPSWETTWEFVRVLAVERLDEDAEETEREWRTRWNTARVAMMERATDIPMLPSSPAPSPPATPTVRLGQWGPARWRTIGAAATVLLAIAAGLATARTTPRGSTAHRAR